LGDALVNPLRLDLVDDVDLLAVVEEFGGYSVGYVFALPLVVGF